MIVKTTCPPVACFTFDRTSVSANQVSPGIPNFLTPIALPNTPLATAPDFSTLLSIPLRIVSHTAGTPSKKVGCSALMSPRQLRTLESASVRLRP